MLARQANARVFLGMLATSLLLTGTAMSLVGGSPPHLLHSWRQVITLALAYTLFAFAVHFVVVWATSNILQKKIQHLPWLIWELWSWIAWLPSLALLAGEQSIWVALVLPCMAAGVAVSLKHRTTRLAEARWPESSLRSLSTEPDSRPFLLFLLPLLFTALAIELSVGMLAARNDWIAGFLLACAVLLPAWRLAHSEGKQTSEQRLGWPQVINSALAMLVLATALIPYVPGAAMGLDINVALRRRPDSAPPPVVQAHARTSGAGYSGIVLLLPPKPAEKKIASPIAATAAPTAIARPILIPFNGAYWYLKESELRPGPDAPVVRGDPLKAKVHSTNALPLVMKAHQSLPERMDVSCCHSLKVDFTNVEKRRGEIMVMVTLGDGKRGAGMTLGMQLLPSSGRPLTGPTQDSLTFQFPQIKPIKQFDELTVEIRTFGTRALDGTQVSVDGFLLQP